MTMFIDLAAVAAVFVADRFHLVPLSKTPFLLLIGWASLRLRGLRWRDVGLRAPPSWPRAIAVGVVAGIAMEALDLFVTKRVEAHLLGAPPDLSDFLPIVGNAKYFALGLVGAWTLAAFGEELVWRGWLLNRVKPELVSLIVVSALFGLAHANQGIPGVVQESFSGLLLALLYLASGRNLFVPIVAHGVTDSIDMLLIFTGTYPGLRH
jgi:membrane protease YdiL (CAAX protease family)